LDYIAANPALGVKPPKEPPSRVNVIDHDEYARIRDALPGPVSRLIVEVAINTGLRWGELTELRVRDLREYRGQAYLEICRAVTDAGTALTGDGRFMVRDMTKGGTHRNVSLRAGICESIEKHVADHGLGEDDLIFPVALLQAEVRAIKAAQRAEVLARPIPEGLTRTEPNDRGRTWRHGTLNAYVQGKCRCEWCRHRMAQWSATRVNGNPVRTSGFGNRSRNTTGHIAGDTFRQLIWRPTLDGLGYPETSRPTFHKLRHAHASWLLAGGADIVVVMARLGHKNIATTQRYLHALDPIDSTALSALDHFETSRGDELARRRRQREA
jgi:integrase